MIDDGWERVGFGDSFVFGRGKRSVIYGGG